MASQLNDSDEEISGINVTPLVDVMLVLLVIFMIAAPAIYQSAIQVQLPRAASASEQAEKMKSLDFTIKKDGALYWGKDLITWEDLDSKLKSIAATIADKTAIISADENTPHGTVVRLMDVLRQTGLTRIGLNVEKK